MAMTVPLYAGFSNRCYQCNEHSIKLLKCSRCKYVTASLFLYLSHITLSSHSRAWKTSPCSPLFCRIARYCSINCQKSAWQSTHRFLCNSHALSGRTEPINDNILAAKSFWDLWRYTLEVWMLFALDYGNMPSDYLTNHW